ncbi:MAG: TonB-dependent receptor [Acidobacteriia bacterium]|nr:TonB-dependent receptor [Terriglobia bacterium]
MKTLPITIAGLLILVLGPASPSYGQSPASTVNEESARGASLTDLSLDQLMAIHVKVTSASKKAENLLEAPAAIFTISAEDIRRGGFSSLPEALRLVPGLYVAKVNSHWWTISARGFNDYLNNKMLVLIDGRSVYTPHFGGVFWALEDIPLEDIDRIEVIRGPGGTLWGANAVNGVINIITRHSGDTQGFSVKTSSGTDEGSAASMRYGDRVGDRLSYRVFGKAAYWEPGIDSSGMPAFDSWNMSQGGIRLDFNLSKKDDLTVESGMYEGRLRAEIPSFTGPGAYQTMPADSYIARGGHVLSRWTRRLSEDSSGSLFGYCDWSDGQSGVDDVRNTCKVEFQHDFQIRRRHSFVWGLSLDTNADTLSESFTVRGTPTRLRTTTASIFAQYQLEIVPGRWRFSTGSKFEHNSYTGFEIQPQIRSVWLPGKGHSIWGAVSRAVRTPSRAYNSEEYKFARLPGVVPTYLTAIGNPALEAEVMTAYEFGYRFNPTPIFSLDGTIFYNHYANLINLNLVDPLGVAGPPRIHTNPLYAEVALPWQNLGPGQTHGLELYVKLRPLSRWMLAAGVTELRGNSVNMNDSLNLPVANSTGHQFNVQSRFDIARHVELDASLYHYNGVAGYVFGGIPFQDVPTHNRVDAGVSFGLKGGFTLSLWGHDLGAGHHWENRPPLFTTSGSQVPGQVVALGIMWRPGERPIAP